MADQVTISTFLELKDNLSPSLGKVEAALARIAQQSQAMQSRLLQSATAAKQLGPALDKVVPQFNKIAAAAKKIESVFKPISKQVDQMTKSVNKLVDAMNRLKNVKPAAGPVPAGGAAGKTPRGGAMSQESILDRKLLLTNLASYGIVKAVGIASDALASLYEKVIEVGMAHEKSISAISAAMYTMGTSPSMKIAETHAERVIAKLREMAALLPGEAAEYVEVYQRSIPSAIASGMKDSMQYADFVSKYTAIAIQRGVGAKVAATNLQILLQGTARAGTKMAQVLSAYTGKTINDINRMTRAARFDLLQQAVEKAAGGLEYSKTKADAIFGELKTRLEDLYRIGGQPLFDSAKASAVDLNRWLEKNKKTIEELAQTVTSSLGRALNGTLQILMSIGDKFNAIFGGKPATAAAARLKQLESPYSLSGVLKRLVPGYGMYASAEDLGEIAEIERQTEEDYKRTKRIVGFSQLYKTLEARYESTLRKPTGSVSEIAEESVDLIKKGMFRGLGKTQSEALSEFLEYKGVADTKIQEVHEALMAKGVFTPTAMAEAPDERANTINDFRYSRFDIRQEFAEGFDPDRIAVAFATDLGMLAERKLSSATAGQGLR